MTRRVLLAVLPMVTALAWAPPAVATSASVVVRPAVSFADAPVHFTGSGFSPKAPISLVLSSTDTLHHEWQATERVRADGRGRFDLDRMKSLDDPAATAWGMRLVAGLRPSGDQTVFYSWRGATDRAFTITAYDGTHRATTTFRRSATPSLVTFSQQTVDDDGFDGAFATPDDPKRHQGVLLIGGSEGGISTGAERLLLAEHGFAALSVGYFKTPRTPAQLKDIPLEYFGAALRWLRGRPEVSRRPIVVIGGSRGSEPALLLGVHYPKLVGGVVAVVPSNVALCGIPGCDAPAWTWRGRPVPYTRQVNTTAPTDDPRAVIPVERINGPVLLACGGLDSVWQSCAFARAIKARLHGRDFSHPYDLRDYPTAGHHIFGPPYLPSSASAAYVDEERAREDLWPRVLAFVKRGAT